MIIELPAYVSDATQNSIKGLKCQRSKGWNFGKKPIEKRLPCYSNQDFYIPKFEEMSLETIELLEMLNAGA
jgi:hypothetical protein